ncbi:MAG: tetratricopeptide repeat protein [Okeania sp. SIO3B5]|uniref:CHAT domain-containing protein n=1 Tax=Okeania sp. SIO3B5 TaxID=2607811 RepID=UPI001400153C|nr:CHAT domain-containing protein [Okeania sp. SIO3B5]NEO54733.1 tetratricopeptide repeat protein [Okeania sp. SIO3B5]
MDEQRIEAYLNLINTLLLNRESEAEFDKIMNDNRELIDSGLWQTMFKEAQKLASAGNHDTGFLLKVANYLAYQDYKSFLMEVLQATVNSGDSKVVYPLLQQNLDKLDNNFVNVLQDWATAKFSEVEADVAESIAKYIGNFSILIQEFPLGNKANNMEISIAGYELMLKVFTSESHRETWASIQYRLGAAYRKRITGDKAENMESVIAAYQNALLVYTQKDFHIDWAMTQNSLGAAYSERITGDKAENMESAIAAYQNALLVRTHKDFHIDWAMTQNNLGLAYWGRITGDKAENIESAIAAYQNALLVYTQKDFPMDWAMTQNNLGLAYWGRITGNKAENIESAIAAFQNALLVRTHKDFHIDWAATQNNLGIAYRDRITGDKAENIESAIAAFQNALQVRTHKDFHIDWAMTQNNLGTAYRDRITGDKAKNVESAIAAYQNALLVYTQKDFPMDWAMTQNNLGLAYEDRITGDKAENIESAIAAFQNALQVYTQKDFPIYWAGTQNNLSIAYRERIKGDKAENIESAIAACQNALLVRTLEANPINWAKTQNNLGAAYRERITGDKAENIESAIAAFQNALLVYTQKDFPIYWAGTQNNLGAAYINRITGYKAENIEFAIAAFQNALQVYTQKDFPINWAGTQNNLGAAYAEFLLNIASQLPSQDYTNFLMEVLQATQDSKSDSKVVYPLLQQNLDKLDNNFADILRNWGTAQFSELEANIAEYCAVVISEFSKLIQQFPLGNKANNMEISIAGYEVVLKVFTSESHRENWAAIQNNIGFAYRDRIRGDKTENIESAIAAFQNALQVRTQKDFPIDWAMTQNNLGTAYFYRIRGDKAENIEFAIAAFQEILLVFTQTDFPMQWATTQNNLGSAYSERITGDKAENIESAIAAYQQALQVRTQKDFPIDWADTQNNLGNAYLYRIRGDKAKNIESAIAAFQNALQVRTQKDFPIDWAMTQNNLGLAHSERITGDKAENIESAIALYQQALLVCTLEANPLEHLKTTHTLGNLYFDNQNWQLAADSYEKAIKAVEVSRSWATTDERRQEIIAEAIQVYQNQVQAYINLEQWDKAIETAERSKARTLVELLVKRELYPKGNVPQEIISELDRLRRNIPSLERQLQIVIEQRSASSGRSEQKRLQQELEKSRQELDELLNQIKPIDPSFTLTERVDPILFRDIQNLLDRDTAMIEWYITGDKIITFIITANSQHPIVEQSSAEDLERHFNWGKNYFKEYYLEKNQWINNLPSHLKRLAEILNIDRLLTQIDNIFEKQGIKCNRLILIPHQFLHLFPLHVMPLKNGDLLIDRFDRGISYAPSSQILQLTQKQKRPHFSQLFAVQNPQDNLIYADLEVETIRHNFDLAEVLIKEDASEAKVKTNSRLQSSHCNHFSCHGNFNPGIANASALYLAKYDSPEDGELTLAEIFGLNLSQCRLVTLSACETGLTDFKSLSDEYIGLPSGFIFAGSPSVVCSLWTVADISTAFLMVKFYQNLKSYPELGEGTVAIALKDAQMWLRNLTSKEGEEFLEKIQPYIDIIYQGKSEILKEVFVDGAKASINSQPHPFNSPYYWAAFTAVGF